MFDKWLSKVSCYFSGHRPNIDLKYYKKQQTGFVTHTSIECLECGKSILYQIEVVRNDKGNFVRLDQA